MKREFPEQPLVGVGAVVVHQGTVLLIERRAEPLAGFWSVPGGLVELGEGTRAAAARETREETGIEVEIGPVVAVVDRIEHPSDRQVRYHYVLIDFLARPKSFATPSAASDARQARWVAWEELGAYRLTPGLAEVLQDARRVDSLY